MLLLPFSSETASPLKVHVPFCFPICHKLTQEPVLLVLVGVGPQSGLEIQSTGYSGTQCGAPWSLLAHLSYLVFVHLSNANHHTPTTVTFSQFLATVTSLLHQECLPHSHLLPGLLSPLIFLWLALYHLSVLI